MYNIMLYICIIRCMYIVCVVYTMCAYVSRKKYLEPNRFILYEYYKHLLNQYIYLFKMNKLILI